VWAEKERLPFFLQESYIFYKSKILNLDCLFMVDVEKEENSPAVIHKHFNQVLKAWNGEIVYVRDQVTSYNRKRLVQHKIPFVVPGNQMYLPMLAVDFREHFRQKRKEIHTYSPATQALLLYWIYNKIDYPDLEKTPTEMAKILDYTKMTMTRAFREIDSTLERDTVSKIKKNSVDRLLHSWIDLRKQLYEHGKSPVSKRYYLNDSKLSSHLTLKAGLSALSAYSMLAAPMHRTFALSNDEWKALKNKNNLHLLAKPDSDCVEIEVWTYPPALFARSNLIDRYSLYLSLRDSGDERIQMALKEMLDGVP